jgi:hypothetical protein
MSEINQEEFKLIVYQYINLKKLCGWMSYRESQKVNNQTFKQADLRDVI